MRCQSVSHGVTLVELLVVLSLLGLMLGVTGLALASLRPPGQDAWTRQVTAARAEAIRTGTPVRLVVSRCEAGTLCSVLPAQFLLLPDGRAVGVGIEPLTGELRAVP